MIRFIMYHILWADNPLCHSILIRWAPTGEFVLGRQERKKPHQTPAADADPCKPPKDGRVSHVGRDLWEEPAGTTLKSTTAGFTAFGHCTRG